MYIKLISFLGFFLILLGFASAPNTAIGQVSDLQKTLVSFGYKVEKKAGVEITAAEKSEFNLQGKLRYGIKSVNPVRGERRLYYRFTVDVEAYQNESDAQKRLDRIIATPPGVDSKMEPHSGFREGFRRENKVYVVSTDVYKFVLDKDLTRLREKLENAVSERMARRRGINIGYIPARRNEAVEASRLLEGDDFRVTLVEYPETSVSAVELIHYPTGSASEARKIADILKCCLGTVAVKESPYTPARVGVDYFLGYLGRSPPRPMADTSHTQDALYFASPRAAIPVITELLRKEDWKTLSSYYDLSNFNTPRSELESGRFFIQDKRPEGAHPGLPWKYKHPFAPGFEFDRAEETKDTSLVTVIVKIRIDEGGGMVQRGFSEFKMRKSDRGYQLLPSDETQSDSPISARFVHEGASLIVGRPAQNLRVAIRNNTATDPRQGVAIVLRGVHWASEGEDTRQWLKQLPGSTRGSPDDYIDFIDYRAGAGVTDLAFETGLILPGKEIIVTAPLTSGQGGKHELVVRYAVVGGDGKDWSGEVLVQTVLPAYDGAWFEPATHVRRLSGATKGIVRSTSKPGASPLPIQQTIIPLQLPVALDPESARERAAELAGVTL